MADKKITQLTNITGANLAGADEFVVVDITADETKAITFDELKTAFDTGTGFVRVTGDTMTGALNVESTITSDGMIVDGDVTFGDSDKAIFGAGSDLQIYHDGSNSYIADTATGSLHIKGTSLFLEDADGNEFIRMSDQGSGGIVYLKNLGATKLATTATGIDVTGTVTSDGLVSAGTAFVNLTSRPAGVPATAGALWSAQTETGNYGIVSRASSTDSFTYIGNTGSSATLGTSFGSSGSYLPLDLQTSDKKRLKIAANGDISFYEDTGTTAKFFWDASAEGLGIGSGGGSLEGLLDLEKTDNTVYTSASRGNGFLQISNQSTTAGAFSGIELIAVGVGSAGSAEILCIDSGSGSGDLAFTTRSNGTWSEKMRIDSSGNVGIGTSSPSEKLHVEGDVRLADASSIQFGSSKYQTLTGTTGSNDLLYRTYANHIFKTTTGASDNTDGSERVRIDASGNVGIGTSSPYANLHSVGTIKVATGNAQGILALGEGGGTAVNVGLWRGAANAPTTDGNFLNLGGYDGMVFATGAAAIGSQTEAMRIDSSGHVGIGDTIPTNGYLTIRGASTSGTANSHIMLTGDSATVGQGPQIAFSESGGASNWVGASIGFERVGGGSVGDLIFSTRRTLGDATSVPTEAMRIDSSGQLLHGISSIPTGVLLGRQLVSSSSTGSEIIAFREDSSITVGDKCGALLIGNSDPDGAEDHFVGMWGKASSTNGSQNLHFAAGRSGYEGDAPQMTLDNQGNLLVGKDTTSAGTRGSYINSNGVFVSAQPNGGDALTFFSTFNSSEVGSIDVTTTATSYNTSSDYRLKTDAQPMTGASARVQALNPVNFEWISDSSRVDGFLAHEAQAVVPESVTGTKDAMKDEEYEVTPAVLDDDGNVTTEAVMGTRSVPDYQGIDQSKLVPLLTAALQEALAKIDAMETRLTALEG